MSTLELQNTSSNGAAASVAINASELVAAAFEPGASLKKLKRALFSVGFLTLVMDLAIYFYRSPGGVVFGHHRLAYYLTLAGIFLAGAAEVSTAWWLSRSSGQARDHRRTTLARTALCCSLLPLVVVVALGGFSVLVKS
ncbi:hypothetical protein BAE44_0019945 [Dichanthelium oligosanthes]|uniref:Uncharacterized protein n=1 Tax=Dichanthelium oligosanthes TaxID=888268 RepID=A0A1E5V1W1_9POAL|nr:hypothetical protein BAE44_0019945 [Dichanthelium oligosanthes]